MEALEKIKELLGMVEVVENNEVTPQELQEAKEHLKFEDAQLEDGTVISADAFEVGAAVFIMVEEEKQPLPVGEYAMADGKMLVVEEEGIIASISEVEEEVEEEVQEQKKKDEEEEYKTEELSDSDSQTKDALVQAIGVLENLVQEFSQIKEEFNTLKAEKAEADAKIEEFEKPGVEITPTPEGSTSNSTGSQINFSQLTPQERVTYLINKNKSL
tara:strand:- start:408 stop:1052 length:645 start_codon:yes stop_codon:yes gene_type:complete